MLRLVHTKVPTTKKKQSLLTVKKSLEHCVDNESYIYGLMENYCISNEQGEIIDLVS